MSSDADGKLVSALVRGVSILNCFSNKRQELSGKELMELTGLPKPTLFRLTETLCELGLLRYSERLSKFVPGIGLLNLSSPVLARMRLRQFARPQMMELANHIGGQIQIGVGSGEKMVLVELANGMDNKVFTPQIGVGMSLSRTATGRAYLLGLPQAEREAYLRRLGERNPERATLLGERLEDARRDLAEHGFCRSHGDLHREILSIAVPMSQALDGEYWVFAASVPIYNPKSRELETDVGPRLTTLVRSVEGVLGASSLS
ncbi:HTH-type transcriptional regulator TsaQ1/TsaQ2 [bioreactor metagenome]|uniref:HTH-type transcriptional regulator TsaQ1/TsaQ2 n=1 Tax=bioreactor metagenome TaxID=1076179 RepID=A0A644Y1Y4_9ZZZZ